MMQFNYIKTHSEKDIGVIDYGDSGTFIVGRASLLEESLLIKSYALRHEVFVNELKWVPSLPTGLDQDKYDELDPYTAVVVGKDGHLNATMRFLPTNGDYLLKDLRPDLITSDIPCDPNIVEVSRLACRRELDRRVTWASLKIIFHGSMGWAAKKGVYAYVALTDVQRLKIFKNTKVPYVQLGPSKKNEDGLEVVAIMGTFGNIYF